ncbi:MAG: dihydroorotate dehydrogenase electron transfer subunit [Treponema sp.]|jgi:NAD(P)H-flavin reductase|nr:dihydroorotate dehydrogenase electron transfer subunit [Treponema sp.]
MKKQSLFCELIDNTSINKELFRLDFACASSGRAKLAKSGAGQFFMIRPRRSSVFLGRPVSVAMWESDTVSFLIARRGRGTLELADMQIGEEAELTGPLGNTWKDFLSKIKNDGKPIALIGGGIGIAPLGALFGESSRRDYDLYAGFKTGFRNKEEKNALLGTALLNADRVVIATEDGRAGHKGRIPDFLEPQNYAAVCACGPEPMLQAVAAKCTAAAVPCFVSLERRMACGVGACLGCTVKTVSGNRRCCADGPIFNAQELIFDD